MLMFKKMGCLSGQITGREKGDIRGDLRERISNGIISGYVIVRYNGKGLLHNERGDVTTVGILGWAAVVITLIVAAHGLLTGWLPNFINTKIIDRANSL